MLQKLATCTGYHLKNYSTVHKHHNYPVFSSTCKYYLRKSWIRNLMIALLIRARMNYRGLNFIIDFFCHSFIVLHVCDVVDTLLACVFLLGLKSDGLKAQLDLRGARALL